MPETNGSVATGQVTDARSDFARAQFSVDYTINIVELEIRQGQGASAIDKSFSRGCDISGVWLVMLRRLPLVQQAAISNCLLYDPFPFDQNGLVSSEGRRRRVSVRHCPS